MWKAALFIVRGSLRFGKHLGIREAFSLGRGILTLVSLHMVSCKRLRGVIFIRVLYFKGGKEIVWRTVSFCQESRCISLESNFLTGCLPVRAISCQQVKGLLHMTYGGVIWKDTIHLLWIEYQMFNKNVNKSRTKQDYSIDIKKYIEKS